MKGHSSARLGEGEPCPHCGAKSGVSPGDDGLYRCLVCGGPRVLVEGERTRAFAEKPLLQEVQSQRARRAAWLVAAAAMGGFGGVAAIAALLVVALADLGAIAGVALAAVVLIPLLLSAYGFGKVKTASARAREAARDAQRAAAAEVIRARPDVSAPVLAAMFHVSEDAAVELMAHAQVGTLLSDSAAHAPRIRVEQEASAAPDAVGEESRAPGRREQHRP